MNQYRIAVIPGDHIGAEVIPEALRVLAAVERRGTARFALATFPWGAGHFLETGRAAPENILDILRPFDAILLGAHGDPARVPDKMGSSQLMHPIRKGFELYANVRPSKWFPGVDIPLRQTDPIDFVVVRENTEGEYSGTGGRLHAGTENELAMQATYVTRRGAERVMRYAFELARKRNGKKYVHCVTKSNALALVMELWDETFARVAADYPDIRTSRAHVDAMSMYVISRPSTFDVVVATNLMGDIISDEASAVTGSIGLAASSNVNPERPRPAMFEPVHGSAPDISGTQKANPLAAILATGMMLDWLGMPHEAAEIDAAVARVLAGRAIRTPDLGGTSTTKNVTDAVLQELDAHVRNPANASLRSGR